MSEGATEKRVRTTLRFPTSMRGTLELAAAIVGIPVDRFIVQVAYEKALEILERERVIRLSQEAAKRGFAVMENPPKPNKRLLTAMKSSKKGMKARVKRGSHAPS